MTSQRPGKERFCWCCGESMGFVENRYYEPGDTCGKPACEREAREAKQMERDQAHEDLDRDRGWN